VLLGDGELQEGQIWESLGSAARDRMSELTVIIDGNGIQSDKWVNETLPLGDLRMRFEGAGWNFFECDGHNITALRKTFRDIQFSDGPTVILAKTVKGKGVRLFEEFPPSGNFYKFHSGAIPHEIYLMAIQEVAMIEIADSNKELGYWVDSEKPRSRSENLIDVWGHLLNEKMQSDPAVYVLDADLSYDTGTSYIREEFSSRYIQCGIAEQDMVSMAGGLALGGIFPIVHSFASFLTMRAAEQIFNNTTERSRILYVGFLAGLIPSAPGFSHQAVNDVSIMCSMPGMKVLEASNPRELKECMALASAYSGPTYLRVVSISLTGDSPLDPLGRFYWRAGQGADILIISSGVTMSLEILQCFSRESNLHSKYQFITGIDLSTELSEEEAEFLLKFKKVVVVENYLRGHGLFQVLLSNRSIREQIELVRIGIDGLPRSGENEKVLKHHGLDSESILGQIYPPK
jgi:transketolase